MLRALSIDVAAFFFGPNMFPADVVMNHFDWVRTFGATRMGSAGSWMYTRHTT
jgi:hypothetical protein